MPGGIQRLVASPPPVASASRPQQCGDDGTADRAPLPDHCWNRHASPGNDMAQTLLLNRFRCGPITRIQPRYFAILNCPAETVAVGRSSALGWAGFTALGCARRGCRPGGTLHHLDPGCGRHRVEHLGMASPALAGRGVLPAVTGLGRQALGGVRLTKPWPRSSTRFPSGSRSRALRCREAAGARVPAQPRVQRRRYRRCRSTRPKPWPGCRVWPRPRGPSWPLRPCRTRP